MIIVWRSEPALCSTALLTKKTIVVSAQCSFSGHLHQDPSPVAVRGISVGLSKYPCAQPVSTLRIRASRHISEHAASD
jgi:hypothetical protein